MHGKEDEIALLIGLKVNTLSLKSAYKILDKMSKDEKDKVEAKIMEMWKSNKAERTKIIRPIKTKVEKLNFIMGV